MHKLTLGRARPQETATRALRSSNGDVAAAVEWISNGGAVGPHHRAAPLLGKVADDAMRVTQDVPMEADTSATGAGEGDADSAADAGLSLEERVSGACSVPHVAVWTCCLTCCRRRVQVAKAQAIIDAKKKARAEAEKVRRRRRCNVVQRTLWSLTVRLVPQQARKEKERKRREGGQKMIEAREELKRTQRQAEYDRRKKV